jgi:hypothetical protein
MGMPEEMQGGTAKWSWQDLVRNCYSLRLVAFLKASVITKTIKAIGGQTPKQKRLLL